MKCTFANGLFLPLAAMGFIKMLIKRMLFLMLVYQLCRLLFWAFNSSYFSGITLAGLFPLLIGSMRFDISILIYINLLYILMFIVPLNIRYNRTYQSVGKVIFLFSNSVGILANLIDCAYFPFILRRTNASFFLEFGNDAHLLGSIGKYIASYWFLTIIVVAFIWLFVKSYKYISMPERKPSGWKRLATEIVLVPVVAIICLGFARGSFIPSTRPINMSYAGDYVSQPGEMTLVLNTPFSILTTLGNIKIPPITYFPSLDAAAKEFNPVQSYHASADSVKKKNVVIIIVESLSREFFASLNRERKDYEYYTPFLDSLISNSLTFKYAFANGKRSIEALPSVTASIPSLTEAFVLTPYSTNRINSLASVLKKYGYETSFFHGAHEGSMGFSAFMKMAGVDRFYSKENYNNDKDYDGTWGIYDEEFLQYWAKSLNSFKEPFYSELFTVTSHHPYKLPAKYDNSFKPGNQANDRAVQYTDMSIRKFFETASKMPWYKNTVFVITADHAATYPYYKEFNNTMGVFSIPIIFYAPDSSLAGFRSDLAQQCDIFPTLVDYLGLQDTIVSFGKSVLRNSDHLVVNCYSGTYQAFKNDLMIQFDGHKLQAVYRYKEDMMMEHNLIGKYPAEEQKILTELKAYIQQYSTRIRENKMVPGT